MCDQVFDLIKGSLRHDQHLPTMHIHTHTEGHIAYVRNIVKLAHCARTHCYSLLSMFTHIHSLFVPICCSPNVDTRIQSIVDVLG